MSTEGIKFELCAKRLHGSLDIFFILLFDQDKDHRTVDLDLKLGRREVHLSHKSSLVSLSRAASHPIHC